MRKKEERLEKQMNEVMAENRRLIEPLQKAKEEVQELQKLVCFFVWFFFFGLDALSLRKKHHTEEGWGV